MKLKYDSENTFIDLENAIERELPNTLEYWQYIPHIGYVAEFFNSVKFRYELIKQNGTLDGKNYYRILGWADLIVPKQDLPYIWNDIIKSHSSF